MAGFYSDPIVQTFSGSLQFIRNKVNLLFMDFEPWQLIIISILLFLSLRYLHEFLFTGDNPFSKVRKIVFRSVKRIPFVRRQIEAEVLKTATGFQNEFGKTLKPGMTFMGQLPANGNSAEEVCRLAADYQSMCHVDIHGGKASGTLYNGAEELTKLNSKMYEMFAWTNPLHADIFPDIRKMEAEVVNMCVDMFHGDSNACGTMTAGGTESIMLACKAYRDRAIANGVKRPEMLVPRSAHAAFEKSAQLFQMHIRFVAPDPRTMRVDVRKMAKMINGNTCMLVASCPDFPLGMIDPIEEIARLGKYYNIPVHVDACLGGFLVPFMEEAGYPLPMFDFRVEGVSSISCDTHKYGFAPKGSSVILYRNHELRRYQFSIITDWPGGIYATPVLGGSRPGAIIAACWATLVYYGRQGYVETTRKIIQTARYITEEIGKIDGIFVYGDPQVCVVGIGSLDFDIYRLSAALSERGWSLNTLQFPSSFHLCVTLCHTKLGVAQQFVNDVADCTAIIMQDPQTKATGMAAIYGMSQTIPDRSLVSELVMEYLDALYMTYPPQTRKNTYGLTNGHLK